MLILMLEKPSADSIEMACEFTKEVGAYLQEVTPAGLHRYVGPEKSTAAALAQQNNSSSSSTPLHTVCSLPYIIVVAVIVSSAKE